MKIRRSQADALFSQYIRRRDGRCRVCPETDNLECAHIYSRRHWATRHDPDNAIALCFRHHRQFTEDPLLFSRWCDEEFGREAMDKLYIRAHATAKKSKYDEGLRVTALKEMLSRLETQQSISRFESRYGDALKRLT